eukprot:343275_1
MNKQTIKLLFLDIDGVMNSVGDLYNAYPDFLKPQCLNRLQQIIKKTKCKIVLSTARRKSDQIKNKIKNDFIKHGIRWSEVYFGDTPILPLNNSLESQRMREIETYLNHIKCQSKYFVEAWCVVDDLKLDSNDMSKHILKGRFVQTDPYVGITDLDVMEIIMILKYYTMKCVVL